MFFIKNNLFLVAFFALIFRLSSQNQFSDNLRISANYHYGFVVPEYQSFNYVVNDDVNSINLNISKKTIGKNDWEQLYNYPELGFSLFYSTLGNDVINGREISFYPFFKLTSVSLQKFSLCNQIGVGISYVTKKFDLKKNYQNIAVGSNLNIHFNYKMDLNYQILKKIQLQSGLSFDHFSNGNLKEPNLGINYLTFYAGFGYLLGNQAEAQIRESGPYQKKNSYEFIYSFGGKHTRALQEKFYLTSSATLEFKWEPSRIFHTGIGADLFYDSSTKIEMTALKSAAYKELYDFRSGIHISQEFVYNRVSLILQEGIYLLLTDQVNQRIMYNRGIVRYKLSSHFLLSIAMKSHLHILDYPEFGVGYKW